jgi:hypothetical protein
MIVMYLIKYGNPNSLHSTNLLQNLWVQFYNPVKLVMLLSYWLALSDLLHTLLHKLQRHLQSTIANHIHLVLITKIDICVFDDKSVLKFQHDISNWCFLVDKKQSDKPSYQPILPLHWFLSNFLSSQHVYHNFTSLMST